MKQPVFIALLFLSMLSGTAASQEAIDVPVHETFTIQSTNLQELRTINVWTPEHYASCTDSLIVLYMLDGGIKEDFPHLAQTIQTLVTAKKIPPIILVGIENTDRRRDLTGPTDVTTDKSIAPIVGQSQPFRTFICEELIPEIANRYRTTCVRGIIGESLAGLFVTETFLLHPELFDFYIAFDPSLWWNNRYLVAQTSSILSTYPTSRKVFWFAGSSAKDISSTVRRFGEILQSKQLSSISWHYSDEKKEKHHTIFRATKEKALIWTFSQL